MSARNVVLREFDNDGFVIVTDNRSKKIDNLVSLYKILTLFRLFYLLINFYNFRKISHMLQCVIFGFM